VVEEHSHNNCPILFITEPDFEIRRTRKDLIQQDDFLHAIQAEIPILAPHKDERIRWPQDLRHAAVS